jgi:hypothetical protein
MGILRMEQPSNTTKKTVIKSAIFFILDAFVINQGVISIFLVLTIVFWWLPKSAFKKYTKQSPKQEFVKVLIYGCTAIAVFTSININNTIAKNRAADLVQTIENYRQATGKYPNTLDNLIPKYFPQLPKAKYTLGFNNFIYLNHEGNISLFYYDFPPFGRPTYIFERKEWIYLD